MAATRPLWISLVLLAAATADAGAGHGEGEHGKEEELPEQVTIRTDGTEITWSILGIVTALLGITCIFEKLQENIYEHTDPTQLPIIDALFSEMTVLGFLSMVTFVVSSAGIITDLSVEVFGNSKEDAGLLKELFEQAHYMLL